MRKSIKLVIIGLITLIIGIGLIWFIMGDSFSLDDECRKEIMLEISNKEQESYMETTTLKKETHIEVEILKNQINNTKTNKDSSGIRGTKFNVDVGVNNITLGQNDEVCLDGDRIAKITLYDIHGKIITNSDTKKCFSVREEREKGHKFKIENKYGENMIIKYDFDNQGKKDIN